MKTLKEIQERIEYTKKALDDLNDMGNLSKDLYLELNTKIEVLEWIIE